MPLRHARRRHAWAGGREREKTKRVCAEDTRIRRLLYPVKLSERLPGTTIVSIGHRSTLDAFHERRITLEPEGGVFVPRARREALPAE